MNNIFFGNPPANVAEFIKQKYKPDDVPAGYTLRFSSEVVETSTNTRKFTYEKPLLRCWYFYIQGKVKLNDPEWTIIDASVVFVKDRTKNMDVTCQCGEFHFFRAAASTGRSDSPIIVSEIVSE